MKHMKISLCLIVKNEQEHLWRCLESLKDYVDEIIITDTGSDDSTVEIAKKYTDKIYFFEWIHDFSAARNFCQSHASWDYILWMDADEWFETSDIKDIKKKIWKHPEINFFSFNITHIYHGRAVKKEEKTRLFKNHKWYKWRWKTHEIIDTAKHSDSYGWICYLKDVNFFHSLDPKEKYWNSIEYFMKSFSDDRENNTLSCIILKEHIKNKKREEIQKHILMIPYIHRRFMTQFVALRETLWHEWYTKEKDMLTVLIKKSLILQKNPNF